MLNTAKCRKPGPIMPKSDEDNPLVGAVIVVGAVVAVAWFMVSTCVLCNFS